MDVRFESISPTQGGGAVQFSVTVQVPDDASEGDIVEKVQQAFEAHRLTAEAQREYAFAQLTPGQREAIEQAERQAVMEQPRPRPGNREARRRSR